MTEEHLSNIELYYSEPEKFSDNSVTVSGAEFRHIAKVMRHKTGDEIYVTNGIGKIFCTELKSISRTEANAEIKREYTYENKLKNIFICIPRLKSADRFEFALEKSVELGITNFIIYISKREVAKGSKIERWKKVTLSAMKQSLRSYLPIIQEKKYEEIINQDSEVILLEQNSENNIRDLKVDKNKKYFFVFGPEGGLDDEELNKVKKNQIYNLDDNRLRTETAIVKFAVILPLLF